MPEVDRREHVRARRAARAALAWRSAWRDRASRAIRGPRGDARAMLPADRAGIRGVPPDASPP